MLCVKNFFYFKSPDLFDVAACQPPQPRAHTDRLPFPRPFGFVLLECETGELSVFGYNSVISDTLRGLVLSLLCVLASVSAIQSTFLMYCTGA